MPYDVVMPQLGMTMTEGSVLRWLKQAGEPVSKGEILFEVQTDKVDMEIEAEASGVLEAILVETGKVVPVGAPIARIATDESGVAGRDGQGDSETALHPEEPRVGALTAMPQATVAPAPAPPAPPREARRLASPRARRMARELSVDLGLVTIPPGKGRITEADVRRAHETLAAQPPGPAVTGEAPSAARRLVAERMAESARTVPHFHLSATADATELVKLRAELVPEVEAHAGARLTFTDLFITALAHALRYAPEALASWQDGAIVRHAGIHIALAVEAGEKLLAPVIRDADRLGLPALARYRHDLVRKARDGRLTLQEMEGAVCTLSNLGVFRVDQFQAIITPPQSLVLAIGRIAARPVVSNGSIVARETVTFTLSLDHRVLDGAAGAKVLQAVVSAIESPYRLLLAYL